MRKLVIVSFISLDGIMQAPGAPTEDPSGGFDNGGWTFPYFDSFMGEVMGRQMGSPFDLLLGHKTYDIFAAHWPRQDPATDPAALVLGKATKYVVASSPVNLEWENSVQIKTNAVAEIAALKKHAGPMLQVHGSSNLIQTLLAADLVDELWLKIFPVTLGTGKRLFATGTHPAAFKLIESSVSPAGVIIANYERSGDLQTGSFI